MSLHTFDRGSWGRADILVDFEGVSNGSDEIRSVLIRHMILRGGGNGRDELGSVLIWHMRSVLIWRINDGRTVEIRVVLIRGEICSADLRHFSSSCHFYFFVTSVFLVFRSLVSLLATSVEPDTAFLAAVAVLCVVYLPDHHFLVG